jgi:transcriptional regulator with XRE-family HTH domain
MNADALASKRVSELRKALGYTLDELAERSGVSRSTISLIERQETSPTAAVLDKLARALGVTLPGLFTDPDQAERTPVSRVSDQPAWTDPGSGYVRRQVSPRGYESAIELVEVTFPPGVTVAFEGAARRSVTHQQAWVLAGEMEITVDRETWRLKTGDCLAMRLGAPIVFRNPTRTRARYALALTTIVSAG